MGLKVNKYKSKGNVGMFDSLESSEKLKKLGNPLSLLNKAIDFEMFRIELEDRLLNHDKKSNAGTKPYDVVLMFKILILQCYYNLSDESVEYQINDRHSFKVIKKEVTESLFCQFDNFLNNAGLLFTEGQIVDASFTEVPRQRNSKEENQAIKSGIGMLRAKGIIGLINLTYNLFRFEQIYRLNLLPIK
jgi:hypothetical protein